MAGKDEFDYGEDLPQGLGGRIIVGFVVAVFLISTFGTGIADTFFSVEGIKPVGEEARKQRMLERDISLWDGTLARYYESKLRQHSRVRELILPRYSYLKYAYLDEAPASITIGRDHWMFLTDRINLRPLSDEALVSSAANCIIAMDRRLAGNGTELIVIPIPRKSWVARDLLPKGIDGRNAVDDGLIDSLKDRGVMTVDLRKPFRSTDPEEIYFKLDTHWTPNATRITAKEAARVAGLLKPEPERLGRLSTRPPSGSHLPGLATLRSLGVDPTEYDLSVFDLREPKMSRIRFSTELLRWFKDPTPEVALALAGTSFSHQQHLARLISHYSGTAVFNGAKQAQPYMTTVNRVLEAYMGGEQRLRWFFWEIPIATIYNAFKETGPHFGAPVSRSFQVCPPKEQRLIIQPPTQWFHIALGKPKAMDKERIPLLTIRSGALAHSGDGVVALRITGRVFGAELPMMLSTGRSSMALHLGPGEFDVSLPIISEAPTAKALVLVAGPREQGRLRLDSASLVHQPVGDEEIVLEPTKASSTVRLEATSPVLVGRRASLELHTLRARHESRKLSVELWTEGAKAPREVTFDAVAGGGAIVLDLGHERGKRLTSVVVRAANGAPDIRSATIFSGEQ